MRSRYTWMARRPSAAWSRLCCGLSAAAFSIACGDNGGEGADAGSEEEVCALDPLEAGAELTGPNGFGVRLVELDPEPPARFDNRWIVELERDGEALADGSIKVTPFMPLHQHGSSEPVVATELEPGRFELEPINLWMPGLWEVRCAVTGGGERDDVVFEVCIDD